MLDSEKTDLLKLIKRTRWQFDVICLYEVQVICFILLPRITAQSHEENAFFFQVPRQEVNDAVFVFDSMIIDIVEQERAVHEGNETYFRSKVDHL